MAVDPLRLLVIGISWPPETFLHRLLDGLAARGVDITLAMHSSPDPDWLRTPNHAWVRMGRQPSQRLFANNAWDVLYFPWNAAAVENLPLFDLGIPVVISCRGAQINIAPHDPGRSALREGLKTTFERATAVHCVSEAILREAQRFGLDADKAQVIHPAVDPVFFSPSATLRAPDGLFRVISTGALIWRKGYEYALQAVRMLKDQDVPVTYEIIGDGPERDRVLYTLHDLELTENVRLAGQVQPEAVRARLQQSDAYLLSSLSEGISNAALEAMACGLSVVSTDCGGMREAIGNGVEGWVVPSRDPAAMAAALKQIYSNPQRARAIGQAARQRVVREFSLEQQISAFLALLRNVAS